MPDSATLLPLALYIGPVRTACWSNRAPTGHRHPNGPCGQSNHFTVSAGMPAGNNYLRQAVGRG